MSQTPIVTENAVISRINRVLAKQSFRLKTARRKSHTVDTLGRHYILDTRTKTLVDSHIALEMYARDLGVLGSHEQLKAGPRQRRTASLL